MTTKKTTTAQKTADLFDNDGQCWEAESGRDLDTVCRMLEASTEYRDGFGTDTYRHDFPDGSSIVVAGSAWDLGLSQDCYCWAGEGHTEDCHDEHEARDTTEEG